MVSMALAGCSSAPPEVPEAPPQLVSSSEAGGAKMWSNIAAFRPVPIQLRAKAAEVCEAVGAQAVGFHPRALDEQGRPFVEGGFLCAPASPASDLTADPR